MAYSPDGKYLALIYKNMLSVLQTNDWKKSFEIEYNNQLSGLTFSPDGKILVFHEISNPVSQEVDLIFFDLEKRTEIRKIHITGSQQKMTYVFSQDGKVFAYGSQSSNEIILLGIRNE